MHQHHPVDRRPGRPADLLYRDDGLQEEPSRRSTSWCPPRPTAKTTQDTPPSIIYVTADSKIFLDDAPVDPDQLGDLLKSKMAANPDFKVAMKADTKAPFGMIIKVMDAAHIAGHRRPADLHGHEQDAGAEIRAP